MERALTTDQPYIRMTLQKFLKTSKKVVSHKNVFGIDEHYDSKNNQKQKQSQIILADGLVSHSCNNSLQFYQSSNKDKQIIQGFSQKYSEFVNKIKFYNESRLKTMEPLKIDKTQQCRKNYKDIYQQRIYKKAMQQKQKLYPFMQKRSKTQHQIKGIIKNSNITPYIEQMNNLVAFSPLDIKLSNSHSQQEELLQEQKLKEKRFLIKTANRKMLRRQFGSNHSVNVNENKIREQQRNINRKKSQTRASNPLQTQLKLAKQTLIQNRRLVPSMGVLKSKYKSQQVRQKLRIKFSKFNFFQKNHQKIKYHPNNSYTSEKKSRNNTFQQNKINFQFNRFNKQGLKGWDFPSEKEIPINLNVSINDYQQF